MEGDRGERRRCGRSSSRFSCAFSTCARIGPAHDCTLCTATSAAAILAHIRPCALHRLLFRSLRFISSPRFSLRRLFPPPCCSFVSLTRPPLAPVAVAHLSGALGPSFSAGPLRCPNPSMHHFPSPLGSSCPPHPEGDEGVAQLVPPGRHGGAASRGRRLPVSRGRRKGEEGKGGGEDKAGEVASGAEWCV